MASVTHNCDICAKAFKNMNLLEIHKENKHQKEGKIFECDKCDQKFSYANKYHCKTKHSDELGFKCKQCDHAFKSSVGLKGHISTIHDLKLKSHKCIPCGKSFGRKGDLRIHNDAIHLGASFPCNQCNYVSSRKAELKQHVIKVHDESQNVKCDICGKLFHCLRYMQSHKRVTHDNSSYKCVFCEFSGKSKDYLSKHTREKHSSKKQECKLCSFTTSYRSALNQHVKRKHSNDIEYLDCSECSKKFKCKTGLGNHFKKFHSEGVNGTPCFICNMEIKGGNYEMNNHMRKHTGERPYECPYCKKRFKYRTWTVSHSCFGWILKKNPCPKCERHFTQKGNLQTHIKRIHKE